MARKLHSNELHGDCQYVFGGVHLLFAGDDGMRKWRAVL